MKNWISKNYKTLIIATFLIPIITVAIVSISHVTKWYGISNPITWAIYLSIGIEIAALSALAAISANMGAKVYFPFGIVTLIQFIGNIYFSYDYIQVDSQSFIHWVELVSPLLEYIGIEGNDYVGHKRFLSLFAGGMLPIISLSFLHMLVRFTQENSEKTKSNEITSSELIGDVSKLRLSDNDLATLEKILAKKQPINNIPQEPTISENSSNSAENEIEKIINDKNGIDLEKIKKQEPLQEYANNTPDEQIKEELESIKELDNIVVENSYEDEFDTYQDYQDIMAKEAIEESKKKVEQVSAEEILKSIIDIPQVTDQVIDQVIDQVPHKHEEPIVTEEPVVTEEVTPQVTPQVDETPITETPLVTQEMPIIEEPVVTEEPVIIEEVTPQVSSQTEEPALTVEPAIETEEITPSTNDGEKKNLLNEAVVDQESQNEIDTTSRLVESENNIHLEKDENNPNQIVYDLDNNKVITVEDEIVSKPKRRGKLYSRNVSNKGIRNTR